MRPPTRRFRDLRCLGPTSRAARLRLIALHGADELYFAACIFTCQGTLPTAEHFIATACAARSLRLPLERELPEPPPQETNLVGIRPLFRRLPSTLVFETSHPSNCLVAAAARFRDHHRRAATIAVASSPCCATAAMDQAAYALDVAHNIYARAGNETAPEDPTKATRPPVYKVIGISLAIASGVFIGTSFVLKKYGLLKANEKYNEVAGEGYGYLKNFYWWAGMILMIIGEICNFVAYAFTDAILVTPLGALSVVICTILSAIFLKERLSIVGKVACFLCIIGSVVIVMNAPEESSVANIQEMQHYAITPGFLSYTGVIVVGSAIVAIWVAPRYAKKNMLVYISICSWIGGLSVVATQGLGAAIVAQVQGTSGPQFKQWFLYVLLAFVIGTLLTEIIYLNVRLHPFLAERRPPTDPPTTESTQSVQRGHGHPHVLRLLHKHHDYYLGCLVPGLQRYRIVHYHGGDGFPHDMLRRGAFTTIQISQGCSRYRRVQGRLGPDPHDCRTRTVRDGAQGRRDPWRRRYCTTLFDGPPKVGGRGTEATP